MGAFPHAIPARPNRKTLAPEWWQEKKWELALPSSAGWPALPFAGAWSEMLDCLASLPSPERVAASIVAAGVATSRARDSFFALRFIDLLLTEMRTHGNRGSLEFRHDGEEKR
jgi:hypothetical protein